jgi:magnesium-transporting ATPase (P-type)
LNSCTFLGGVDTICFDKTGTLTLNKIQVSHIFSEGKEVSYRDTLNEKLSKKTLIAVREAILSTNTATIIDEEVESMTMYNCSTPSYFKNNEDEINQT